MTKPEAARYRTTNWKSYNSALRQRGSLLIWLDKDMVWLAPQTGRNGCPPVFSDAAVQFCQMVKVLFGLPLRQTTGMVASAPLPLHEMRSSAQPNAWAEPSGSARADIMPEVGSKRE